MQIRISRPAILPLFTYCNDAILYNATLTEFGIQSATTSTFRPIIFIAKREIPNQISMKTIKFTTDGWTGGQTKMRPNENRISSSFQFFGVDFFTEIFKHQEYMLTCNRSSARWNKSNDVCSEKTCSARSKKNLGDDWKKIPKYNL